MRNNTRERQLPRRQRRREKSVMPEEGFHVYYYVTCIFEGRRQLVGPYPTEGEAQRVGCIKFPVDFQVVSFTTSDLNEASRRLKGKLIDGYGLREAVKRLGHKKEG